MKIGLYDVLAFLWFSAVCVSYMLFVFGSAACAVTVGIGVLDATKSQFLAILSCIVTYMAGMSGWHRLAHVDPPWRKKKS